MDSMYSIPTDDEVVKCIVTKEVVNEEKEPRLIREPQAGKPIAQKKRMK